MKIEKTPIDIAESAILKTGLKKIKRSLAEESSYLLNFVIDLIVKLEHPRVNL